MNLDKPIIKTCKLVVVDLRQAQALSEIAKREETR